MTSSYQSTSFQSSAGPVDTFVRQSTVPLIEEDGFSQLTKALSAVNPILDMYMDRHIKKVQDQAAVNAYDQYNEEVDDTAFQTEYKNQIKSIRKTLGNDAADSVTTNSFVYKNAYESSMSQLVGSGISTNLDNAYNNDLIDGKPIYSYAWESSEVQNWLQESMSKEVTLLEKIGYKNFEKNFIPQQDKAIRSLYKTFKKDRSEYRIDNHVANAAPIIYEAFHNYEDSNFNLPITGAAVVDEEKIIISDTLIKSFEMNTNTLGLSSAQMKSVNVAREEAVIDLARTRGMNLIKEGATDELTTELENVLEFANRIPTGRDGQIKLGDTSSFKKKAYALTKELNNYDKDIRIRNKLLEENAVDNQLTGLIGSFPEDESVEKIEAWQEKKNLFLREYPEYAKELNTVTKAYGTSDIDAANDLFVQTMTGELGGTKTAMALQWNKWFNGTPQTEPFSKLLKEGINAVDDFFQGSSRDIDDFISDGQTLINGYIKKDEKSGFYINGTDAVRVDVNYWWRNKIIDLYKTKRKELGRKPEREEIEPEFRTLIDTIKLKVQTELTKSNLADFINSGLLPESNVNLDPPTPSVTTPPSTDKKDPLVKAIENIKLPSNIPKSPRDQFLQDQKQNIPAGDASFASPITQADIDREKVLDQEEARSYLVQAGDTLTSIAESVGTTVSNIMEANNITNADVITAGQELIMPIVNTIGDAVVPESDLTNRSVLEEIDITQPFTYDSLYRLALEVGFLPEDAQIMAAIALAESGGVAGIDTVQSGLDPNKENEFSLGLWQIDMQDTPGYMVGTERRPKFKIKSNEELYNPLTNAKAAKIVFEEQGFKAWTQYKNNEYKKFLPKPK
jgi:murein DD-endopeptidase MepM/ murein hydrolase activator NlpD